MEEKALAPVEEKAPELVSPIAPIEVIVQRFKDLEELKRKLLSDEDYYLTERGTHELKIRGWRKLAVAFGLSVDPPIEELTRDEKDPRELRVRMEVTVRHPRGRSIAGIGWFSSREVKHKWLEDGSCVHPTRLDKSGDPIPVPLEHTVASRAYTRALKRAVQDMVGPIELEEEELEEPEQPGGRARPVAQPSAVVQPKVIPQKAHAQQAAVIWDFLDRILGEEVADHVTIESLVDEVVVKLDKRLVEEYGPAFLSAMRQWGYGVTNEPAGLVARLKRPKG